MSIARVTVAIVAAQNLHKEISMNTICYYVIACNHADALRPETVRMSEEAVYQAWGEMLPSMQAVAYIWRIEAVPRRPFATKKAPKRHTLTHK